MTFDLAGFSSSLVHGLPRQEDAANVPPLVLQVPRDPQKGFPVRSAHDERHVLLELELVARGVRRGPLAVD